MNNITGHFTELMLHGVPVYL